MNKERATEQLKSDFVKALNLGSPHEWDQGQFKKISEDLAGVSGITISVNTLKRLFGKIKTEDGYQPQVSTLNALAKYIGQEHFYAYRKYIGTSEELYEVITDTRTTSVFIL